MPVLFLLCVSLFIFIGAERHHHLRQTCLEIKFSIIDRCDWSFFNVCLSSEGVLLRHDPCFAMIVLNLNVISRKPSYMEVKFQLCFIVWEVHDVYAVVCIVAIWYWLCPARRLFDLLSSHGWSFHLFDDALLRKRYTATSSTVKLLLMT